MASTAGSTRYRMFMRRQSDIHNLLFTKGVNDITCKDQIEKDPHERSFTKRKLQESKVSSLAMQSGILPEPKLHQIVNFLRGS